MKAVIYEAFGGPLTVRDVPDPVPSEQGCVIEVRATGLCRSDWHGWMGHDPDIALPHVPGHEIAGVIAAVGAGVEGWRAGDRVTLPFVCACGRCAECASGNHQVCERQTQPGFTHWGSFAEYVAIEHAAVNLVRLPEAIDFVTAASLGCRFATAFRAVVDQGRVTPGQWVAVHGCGGVGLSAVMIAAAVGARVVAVDITEEKLALARAAGAAETVNAAELVKTAEVGDVAEGEDVAASEDVAELKDVVAAVVDLTGGGAHVSIDALGHPRTAFDSIANLRRRGRHVQVGLLAGEERHPAVPMDRVIAHELEIVGSHGMQAHHYGEMLGMIERGMLQPERLVGERIALEEAPGALAAMGEFRAAGVTVIDRF